MPARGVEKRTEGRVAHVAPVLVRPPAAPQWSAGRSMIARAGKQPPSDSPGLGVICEAAYGERHCGMNPAASCSRRAVVGAGCRAFSAATDGGFMRQEDPLKSTRAR